MKRLLAEGTGILNVLPPAMDALETEVMRAVAVHAACVRVESCMRPCYERACGMCSFAGIPSSHVCLCGWNVEVGTLECNYFFKLINDMIESSIEHE